MGCLPKQFLCRFDLHTGALSIGIFMCLVHAGCMVTTIVQAVMLADVVPVLQFPWTGAFSYSVTAVLFCFALLITTFWFLYGVSKRKSSVVLSWLVVTTLWLAIAVCELLIMLVTFACRAKVIVWAVSACFALIAIVILIYCLLVVYAYYKELKNRPAA